MKLVLKKQIAVVCFLLLLGLGIDSIAQHQTGSPYSMYGVGIINHGGDAIMMSMGGAGIALPSKNRINSSNPASLTYIDSLSFFMDAQVGGYYEKYGTTLSSNNSSDMSFDAINFAFRIKPWWGFSFGLNSYSQIGYSLFSNQDLFGSSNTFVKNFEGSGGLTRLQFNNGFRILPGLSVGVESSLIWGQLVATETSLFSGVSGENMINERTYHLNNFYLSGGLQYEKQFGDKNIIHLGVVANAKSTLGTTYNQVISGAGGAEYVNKNYRTDNYQLPLGWGAGFAWNYNQTWTFAADYRYSKWSDVSKTMRYATYQDSYGVNAGLEFSPQKNAFQSFFYRMKYRVGGFYRQSYLSFNGTSIMDRGFSAGFSIPMRQKKNAFNIAYEYRVNGTNSAGLIKEQINSLKIGILLSETWFYKSKFE